MFSNSFIGFLIAIGFGTWVYSKLMNKTGKNMSQAATVAFVAAATAFLITVTLLSFISRN